MEPATEDHVVEQIEIAREGKTALLIALQFSGLPDVLRGAILLSSLVLPSTAIPLVLWQQGSVSKPTALFAGVGIFLVALLWLNSLRVYLSKRALRVVIRRIKRACLLGELASDCPGCGLQTAAPTHDTSFSCPNCQLELLSSDGVIVSLSERNNNRVAAWTLRAKKLVDADRESQSSAMARHRKWSKLIVILNVVFPVAGIVWVVLG